MKGQFGIEQLITLAVFITFVTYFFFQFLALRPVYLREVRNERIRAEAYQTSELLINDPGYPVDWNLNLSLAQRIGLSDQKVNRTNFLSLNKISTLDSQCKADYYNVKKYLGSDYDFSMILIDKFTGLPIIDCHPPKIIARGINVTVRRIAAFGSSYGELILQMW